jgi:hypothetical protein
MKIKQEEIRQNYIDAAVLHRESSYHGDHKTANKQYGILKKFFKQIEQNKIDKNLLIELLKHENICVRSWAAAHLLGIKFETVKAEEELKSIASMPNAGMVGFSAEMTLKVWKQQGNLKF